MKEAKKVFVDTASFIYFLEGDSKESIYSRDMFLYYDNFGFKMITSVFTDIEYKALPKRNNQYLKLSAYDNFKNEFNIDTCSINRNVCNIALDIRSNFPSIKLIDALQLAIATDNDCDIFVTNDKDLVKYNGLKCVLIEDYKIND